MDCLKMITVKHNGVAHKVPCGRCAFCLTNRRNQWAFRIYHEMKMQCTPDWLGRYVLPGYFLTLTYADWMLPRLDDGRPTLRFRHIQLFFKRIRKAGYKCKYIAVGEYGPETQRPHYHLILWTDCPQLKLDAFWSNSDNKLRGHIHYGTLTMASAMYCLKYIIQPKVREEDSYGPDGTIRQAREDTRAQYSRGIGISYMNTQVYEWHTQDEDEPIGYSFIEGKKVPLPRYYRSKIFTKYQMHKEREKHIERKTKELDEELQRIATLGVADPKSYYYSQRVDRALAIMKKTKHGQKL